MSKKQAFVSLDVSNWYKIHQIHDSDIFQLKIRIPDKNNLFATLTTPGLRKTLQIAKLEYFICKWLVMIAIFVQQLFVPHAVMWCA